MNTDTMHIGMKVRHPGYGTGTVVVLTEQTCDIEFDDGNKRTVSPSGSSLVPAEPQADIKGLTIPLEKMIGKVAEEVIAQIGVEDPSKTVDLLGSRWVDGDLILAPSDKTLQKKEIPIETFFHKIVMMRNQLRVLEQKINSHSGLSETEKIDMQQYITRCYGSMTTFNLLFKNKEDSFN